MDAVDYIDPNGQQFDFSDITADTVEYCLRYCPKPVAMAQYPVQGHICTMNNRLMVPLMCRKQRPLNTGQDRKDTNAQIKEVCVVFVVCTGSPYTTVHISVTAGNRSIDSGNW